MDIKTFKGKAILPYLDALAKLRIDIFREYPYLYEGTMDYEEKYLQSYADCPDTVISVAFDRDKIVGASTATPLAMAYDIWQAPFLEQNYNLNEFFYFGEFILLPEYRGKGLCTRFFTLAENAARDYGSHFATLCSVKRPDNHPDKPMHYQGVDSLWEHFGYRRDDTLVALAKWQDIGDSDETEKPMIFWIKELS